MPRLLTPALSPNHENRVGISPTGKFRVDVALLRRLSLALYGLADALDRVAERIAPSVKPASDYVEFVERLQREALELHNARAAKDWAGARAQVDGGAASLRKSVAKLRKQVACELRVIRGGAA